MRTVILLPSLLALLCPTLCISVPLHRQISVGFVSNIVTNSRRRLYPTVAASSEDGPPSFTPSPEEISAALFSGGDVRPIILFDGVCNLCNGGVNFALDNDEVGNFRFAALQSNAGRALLSSHGKRADDFSSIVLVTPDGAYFKSDAVVRIARGLDGKALQTVGYLGPFVPSILRDVIYDFVADNRYRFGESDSCRLEDDRFDDRFVGASAAPECVQ